VKRLLFFSYYCTGFVFSVGCRRTMRLCADVEVLVDPEVHARI
jgi:hypothetical protein